jgi:glycosyltransferase involved in cell wall biosynthesis
MKFSVITPSYNQGKYIKNTLDSVLSLQQGCEIEHLVIDGGSQDQTISILTSYSKFYPNLIWSSAPDRGQSDALNKGLKFAQGDIISYINSDDYYLQKSLNFVGKIFDKYPEVDFVYGDIFIANAMGIITRRVKSLKTSLWHQFYSFPFPQQSCFWRRRLFQLVPEFNRENKTCMDGEYFAHILTHSVTFCRVSHPIACFRIHDESISGSRKLAELYERDKKMLREKFLPSFSRLPQTPLYLTGRLSKMIKLFGRPELEIFKYQP